MYCPKCDRTIKKERLDQVKKELKSRFDSDSLEKNVCPVCGTPLIDVSKKWEGRSAPR